MKSNCKLLEHGSYKKLNLFSRTFQGLFKDQIYFSRTLCGMSCYLFNTMNHSVQTKLATICGSRHFAPKQMPTQRFNSVMSTQLHVACTRAFQLIFETADQSGFSSHFGSCSALPFQFFAVFLCLFAKLKQKNTLNFTMQLCCEASNSMLGKMQGLFKTV